MAMLEQLSPEIRTLFLVSGTYAHHGIDFRIVSVLLYHIGWKSKFENGRSCWFRDIFFPSGMEWIWLCRGCLDVLIATNVKGYSIHLSVRYRSITVQNSYRVVKSISKEKLFVNCQHYRGSAWDLILYLTSSDTLAAR